jgi:O-antigen/teichoic acid export membrane protein
MSRKKLFIENIFAYGFINILNKIVPFLLLPIITRMLPDASDFGVYSMYTTIVGFGTPLVVLGLYDAMFREYFEKDEMQYRYNVTTTTHRIIMLTSVVIVTLMVLFNKALSNLFFGNSSYNHIVILAAIGVFLGGIINIIQAPTRMQNQRRVFVISGLMSSLVTYLLALALIYYGFSYFGLIYSGIIATTLVLILFWFRNKSFFTKGSFDVNIAKELLRIGLPLLPTFLIYWIYNSMDKIMITNMLGTFDLGIYSIGSKMSQASQLIYAGFAGGWQYFAFSTMKDDDQVQLNSKVFEYLGAITVLSFIVIFPFIPILFNLLFTGDYVLGYIVAPYLFLSPLLLMLFQIVANQFLVIKRSYFATLSLSLGACINVLLNFLLIKKIGIEGAAIATLIGYLITLITVMYVSFKTRCMQYSRRIILILSIIPVYSFIQRTISLENKVVQFSSMFIMCILIVILYRNEFSQVFRKVVNR